MAGDNLNSFLRIDKPEIEFADAFNSYDAQIYARGKENLDLFQSRGVLLRDPKPCFYLYRQTMDGRLQTGLLALTSVAEYNDGRIKKHEHTRPEKVNDLPIILSSQIRRPRPCFQLLSGIPTLQVYLVRFSPSRR